jgi:hypothetical protein
MSSVQICSACCVSDARPLLNDTHNSPVYLREVAEGGGGALKRHTYQPNISCVQSNFTVVFPNFPAIPPINNI